MDLYNKDIVDKFNKLFTEYRFISEFCNRYDNDVDRIILEINYLIKFIFVNKKSFKMYGLLDFYNYDRDDLEKEYLEYVEKYKKNKLFNLKHNKKRKINESLLDVIDISIRIEDLEGFNILTKERINEICINNKREISSREDSLRKKREFYDKKSKFRESVLFYSRPDFVTLDKSFIYYHEKFIGDLSKDYESIVNDGRYNANDFNNPFRNNYLINLANIRNHNDILLRKYGDVYCIDNGRHRLLYLMVCFNDVTIPISNIRRRIEDREFNIILKNIIDNYNVYIFKNNILNDDPNILIMYNEKLYNLCNKDMLRDFYYRLERNDDLDIYYVGNSYFDRTARRRDEIDKYSLMLYDKYREFGSEFINNNFTDIMRCFKFENNYYLRDAFETMQFNYRRAEVFKYSFDKYYDVLLNLDKSRNNDKIKVNILKNNHD